MIPFSQVKPQALKLRVATKYPGSYIAGSGIRVDQSGGSVTTSVDFSNLERDDVLDLTNLYLPTWDPTEKIFKLTLPDAFRGPTGPAATPTEDFAKVLALSITRAQIASVTIPVNSFQVDGFSTIGDLGRGAPYKRGTSAGPMAIQDASGAWFILDVVGRWVKPGWYGAVGDGSTSDSTAFNTMASTAKLYDIQAANFRQTATINLPSSFKWRGAGVGNSIITRIDGNYGNTINVSAGADFEISDTWFWHQHAFASGNTNPIWATDYITNRCTNGGAHIAIAGSVLGRIFNNRIWNMAYGITYSGCNICETYANNINGVWEPANSGLQEMQAGIRYMNHCQTMSQRKNSIAGLLNGSVHADVTYGSYTASAPVFAVNASATTTAIGVVAGSYTYQATGTFAGATARIQKSTDAGVTWSNFSPDATLTSNGTVTGLTITGTTVVRLQITGATGTPSITAQIWNDGTGHGTGPVYGAWVQSGEGFSSVDDYIGGCSTHAIYLNPSSSTDALKLVQIDSPFLDLYSPSAGICVDVADSAVIVGLSITNVGFEGGHRTPNFLRVNPNPNSSFPAVGRLTVTGCKGQDLAESPIVLRGVDVGFIGHNQMMGNVFEGFTAGATASGMYASTGCRRIETAHNQYGGAVNIPSAATGMLKYGEYFDVDADANISWNSTGCSLLTGASGALPVYPLFQDVASASAASLPPGGSKFRFTGSTNVTSFTGNVRDRVSFYTVNSISVLGVPVTPGRVYEAFYAGGGTYFLGST